MLLEKIWYEKKYRTQREKWNTYPGTSTGKRKKKFKTETENENKKLQNNYEDKKKKR